MITYMLVGALIALNIITCLYLAQMIYLIQDIDSYNNQPINIAFKQRATVDIDPTGIMFVMSGFTFLGSAIGFIVWSLINV